MSTVKYFDADRKAGHLVGTDYYLMKDFSGKELIALINKILKEKYEKLGS